jgi:5-methylcytosine-specific restriction protein B
VSRYCGEKEIKPILEAAEHWKNSCLVGAGSVFSGEQLWRDEYLDALDRDYVARPDVGEGVFLKKLEQQLAPSPDGAKRLAAEMLWLLYLGPSSITVKHKRNVVDTVWSWSGTKRPDTAWMSDDVLTGIGSGGPGFNQNQWRELAFLINLMRASAGWIVNKRCACLRMDGALPTGLRKCRIGMRGSFGTCSSSFSFLMTLSAYSLKATGGQ